MNKNTQAGEIRSQIFQADFDLLIPLKTLHNLEVLELMAHAEDGVPEPWRCLNKLTNTTAALGPWTDVPATLLALNSLVEVTVWIDAGAEVALLARQWYGRLSHLTKLTLNRRSQDDLPSDEDEAVVCSDVREELCRDSIVLCRGEVSMQDSE